MQASSIASASHHTTDIAIIGAGFSGAMLATALHGSGKRVLIIDPSSLLARGAAYGTTWPEHLLNVPAVRMGALASDVAGFHRWLLSPEATPHIARYGLATPVAEDAFVPRALYGDYLESLTHQALQQVQQLKTAAETISCDTTSITITTALGTVVARHCVLATGNGFAHALPGNTHYHNPPWLADFDAIAAEESEHAHIIIGSGLTAVDTLISLLQRKVRAPITVVSRHGLFPASHTEKPLSTPPPFSPEMLSQNTLSARMWALRQFIDDAVAQGSSWQSALDALRPHTVALWQSLNMPQQQRFFRHAFSHWNRARHRMAPHLYAELALAQAQGRFVVVRGSVAHLSASRVQLASGEVLRSHHTFDCRGPRYQIDSLPLVSPLITSGICDAHPSGLGFIAHNAAGRISREGFAPIYAIGPLLLADRLETTAVPELRQAVAALAAALAA